VTTFRVGVAGLGVASRFWLRPLAATPDVEVVAVVEPDPARVAAARAEHGLTCAAYARLEDALEAERIDVVVNLTPPAAHRGVVERALRAGCHVLGEKPMAATYEDALALVECAQGEGRTFAIMQNRRYQPAIRRLRAAIAAGAIGDPVVLGADLFMAPHHSNTFIEAMEQPLLMELAVHTFDQARYLGGAEPLAVDCSLIDPPNSWYAGPAAAACTFELAGGALFSYRASCVADGFPTSYDAVWRISGTRGTAIWDSFGEPCAEIAGAWTGERGAAPVERMRLEIEPAEDATGHAACLRELLAALRAGRAPETDCSDNIRSLAMAFAAARSAREGRRVRLDELDRVPRGR